MKIIEILYGYEMIYSNELLQYIQGENLQKIKEITYTLALIVKENIEQPIHKILRDRINYIINAKLEN